MPWRNESTPLKWRVQRTCTEPHVMGLVAPQHRKGVASPLHTSRAERTETASEHPALSCAPHSAPWVEELTPAPRPEEVFERLVSLPHVLFFDSALRHPTLGRYSFLMADPFEWLQARASRTSVSGEPQNREAADPFAVLAERLTRYRAE